MENFLGKFRLEKSENYDEHMRQLRIPWLLRKLAKLNKPTKTFVKVDGNSFKLLDNVTMGLTFEWGPFMLNEPYTAIGLLSLLEMAMGKQHLITWTLDDSGQNLFERQAFVNNKGNVYDEIVTTYQRNGDHLITNVEQGDVHCRQLFKKV